MKHGAYQEKDADVMFVDCGHSHSTIFIVNYSKVGDGGGEEEEAY